VSFRRFNPKLPPPPSRSGAPNPLEPPPERSYWELLPRRNLRRALFLVLALGGVLFIKHTGGLSFRKMFDGVAPAQDGAGFQHLEVRRPSRAAPSAPSAPDHP
jgi:hypothetical protein